MSDAFMYRTLFVAILVVVTMAVYAQAQQPNAAKLKADAQNVVKIISAEAKTQTYCQMMDLSDQADQATEEESSRACTESNRIGRDIRSRICRVASQP